MLSNRRGQSTVEIAVLVAVIIGALLAMQIYVKRGAMGRYRDASDQIGEQFTPLGTKTNFLTTQTANRHEVLNATGRQTSNTQGTHEVRTRNGTEEVVNTLNAEKLF